MPHLVIGVFASGTGSNCRAIHQAIKDGRLDAHIAVILSSQSDAPILTWAKETGIPGFHLSSDQFSTIGEFHKMVLQTLHERNVNLLVLAGYMKKLGTPILSAYPDRVVNIHPALLPAFGGKGMYGRYVHEAVLSYGAKVTGVTVHLVDGEYDHGPVVMQEPVRVEDSDTVESLSARVLEAEHRTYWRALDLFAKDLITINDRKISLKKTEGGKK